MAPLVAPGICRFAVNQTYTGRPVVNVIDMQIDTTGTATSRESAIVTVANDILLGWHGNVRLKQSNDLTCVSVSWVDLDELDGSTGSVSSASGTSWPAAGAEAGAAFPSNVAALVTKVSPGGGRRYRNGRMYIAGLAQANALSDNWSQFNPTAQAAFQTELTDFFNAIETPADGIGGISYKPVLVHTHAVDPDDESPTIVYDGYTDITSFTLQARFATQRRRLRKS